MANSIAFALPMNNIGGLMQFLYFLAWQTFAPGVFHLS